MYNSKSRYIAEQIMDDILVQGLTHDAALPSERQIAKQFSCANATAKKAFDILADLGIVYKKNRSGAFVLNPPLPKPKIALVGEINNPIVINLGLRNLNLSAKLCFEFLSEIDCDFSHVKYKDIIKNSEEHNLKLLSDFNGLLVCTSSIDEKTIPVFQKYNGPIVVFNNDFPQKDIICSEVIADYSTGLTAAFNKIRPETYSKIILIHANHPNGMARINVTKDVLAKFNCFNYETIEVKMILRDSGQISGYQSVRPIAESFRDALVISASDFLSFGVIEALHEIGLEVGKDLSLLSIDNFESLVASSSCEPILSSISMERDTLVKESVNLLLYMIKNQSKCIYKVLIPTDIKFRKSTKEIEQT